MPYDDIESIPAQVRTHKGVKLTLAQANNWAKIYDALKNNPKLENPAAVAWTTWEKVYMLKEDKWVSRKSESKADYECECLECGKKIISSEHCTDIKCSECGGEMRRVGRPGVGKSKEYMESVLFMTDPALGVKEVDGSDNLVVHGVAVTLNVSNGHRFPEDVLEKDIGTLIGQPLVEGHSLWPMDVEVKDMYGMVVDAWYNHEEKHAEFYAEVWDDNYKIVLDKMPHRVKFSVGFSHDFDVEEETEIHVSKEVFFDHIGTTNRPADTDSVLLGIKQDAEARGRCVRMEGKRTIVVESDILVDAKGGKSMTDENTGEPEPETPPVPPVEEPETPPVDGADDVSEPETPPAEPPAPVDETVDAGDDEPAEGKTEEMGKRLEDMNTALKIEQDKTKELESKVQAFERAEKRSKVEEYVDSLVEAKKKSPAQKDALVDQYLTFDETQMKREMEINEVSADLSDLFGEKAVMEVTEPEEKVPERKTIT